MNASHPQRTLAALVRYFLRLGASGFGGPIALVGYMQRDLVEARKWFTEQEFQQALAVGQMMPNHIAACAASGPGIVCPTASACWNSASVNQRRSSTRSRCM